MNVNNLDIDIQIVSNYEPIPTAQQFIDWAEAALKNKKAEITIRVVDIDESAELNKSYRNKEGPTNVLSFPLSSLHDETSLLGDVVICAPIVGKEAKEQNKSLLAHFAHLTIHGILHLQGYDHINQNDAAIMEKLEIAILNTLGFPNPYE